MTSQACSLRATRGAGPDFIRDMFDTIAKNDDFLPTFRNIRAACSAASERRGAFDDDVDIDYPAVGTASGPVRDLRS